MESIKDNRIAVLIWKDEETLNNYDDSTVIFILFSRGSSDKLASGTIGPTTSELGLI